MDEQKIPTTFSKVIQSISVIVEGQERVISVVEALLKETKDLFPDNKNMVILNSRIEFMSEKFEKLAAECGVYRERIMSKIEGTAAALDEKSDQWRDSLNSSNREHVIIRDSVLDKVSERQKEYNIRLRSLESVAANLDKQIAVMALKVGTITAFITSVLTAFAIHIVTKG